MSEKQTHSFQAEVNEVLSIVVRSLYSHREVFLRELISNASDALDRLSFLSLTQHDLADDGERTIDLIPSKEARTLTIRDNGIGMTREETVQNLGTIAHSGSKKMLEALSGDDKKDLSLIGQFGVGFYSAFLVADEVTVTTRAAGVDEPASEWQSDAKGEFTVGDSEREQHGSNVILHLKEDATEYLDEWTLQSLVRKYSDYVRYPIRLRVERQKPVGDEKDESGQPKETETVHEWQTINSASALWTRPKSEISDEQYGEFYKHLSHDWNEPLAWSHFKVEGTHELTGMLFLPKQPPMDMGDRKARGLRLFVKRVFIMDECDDILPEWLRFVRGIVDSEDLPLNVSRELLQQDRTTQFIRKQIIQKSLALLDDLAAEGEKAVEGDDGKDKIVDRYLEFWNAFGTVLKEGVHVEHAQRERIAALLRYRSSNGDGWTSLHDYVKRMPEDQSAIYYVTALNLETARNSPHIEALRARGYEVIYMTDPIDEWVVDSLPEIDGKKLVAATKGSLDLPESDDDKKEKEEETSQFQGTIDKVKGLFEQNIEEVRLTDRLKDSPACLVTNAHGMSPHLERILRANGQDVPQQKRILELNPHHPVIESLRAMADDSAREKQFEQWSHLIYDQALIAEGSLPEDPARLARAIAELMQEAAPGAN